MIVHKIDFGQPWTCLTNNVDSFKSWLKVIRYGHESRTLSKLLNKCLICHMLRSNESYRMFDSLLFANIVDADHNWVTSPVLGGTPMMLSHFEKSLFCNNTFKST